MKPRTNKILFIAFAIFVLGSLAGSMFSYHSPYFSPLSPSVLDSSFALPISFPQNVITSLESIWIDVDLFESYFVNSFVITNQGVADLEEFELSLPFEISSLKFFQEDAEIPVKIQSTAEETTIQARLLTPLPKGGSSKLTLHATTPSLVEQLGSNEFLFLINFRFSIPQSINLTIGLPPGSSLLNQSSDNEFVLFPEVTSNFSDGLRMYFYWENLTISSSQVVLIRFMFPQTPLGQSNLHTGTLIIISFLLGATVTILFISGIVYLLIRFDRLSFRYGRIDSEKVRPVHLSIPEHKIVKTLRKSGGSMLQSDLVEAVQFSKAAVSQYLKKLEEKGVVAKEPAGRTNRVILLADPSRAPETTDVPES